MAYMRELKRQQPRSAFVVSFQAYVTTVHVNVKVNKQLTKAVFTFYTQTAQQFYIVCTAIHASCS